MTPPQPDGPRSPPGGLLPRLRLRTRFTFYFTTLIAVVMVVAAAVVELRLGGLIATQAERRALSIARSLAAVCQPALVTYNYVALTQNAERAKGEEPGIVDVIILDKEGHVAAWSGHGERQGGVPDDPLSRRVAASPFELIVPVELPREDGGSERALDVSVPVHVEASAEKWGTVRVRLSTEDMHRELRQLRLTLVFVTLLAALLGVLGSFVMARRITEPLAFLVGGTIRAAAGNMQTRIEVRTGDELEDLANNFNAMIRQLEAHQRAIEELNRDLEHKVRARTEDLERANQALRRAMAEAQKAEGQLILSEKMASLGQFVAGIAHEINTPSSAIGAAVVNIAEYLDALTRQIRALTAVQLPPVSAEGFYGLIARALSAEALRRRSPTAEIRQRSRALSAVLERGSVKNPRELALTFSRLGLHQELAELIENGEPLPPACLDFLENVGALAVAVNDIRLSIEAITRMVKALKSYAHHDQADMVEADIHDGIETTLVILRNQIKYGIVVERKYARLPPVTCNVGELNQVWTNIIHNAVQAMNGMGTLTIETFVRDGSAGVRITDTGPGIPEEIKARIFDPFFTTKDQGEGAGLGLGIAQQIVRRHHGTIQVESEPGRTSFEVLLPLLAERVESRP